MPVLTSQCWCGDKYDANGTSEHCSMSCTGDEHQYCGGPNSVSVYDALFLHVSDPTH